MATPASGQPAAGPRYASEDPTLPKPWTGLIDGTTGLLYYWNPETNVTQYEKPEPVSAAPPQAASTPKLAQIPMSHSLQQQQQIQSISQWPLQQQQQAQISANLVNIVPVQVGQRAIQSEQSRPLALQHPTQQMLSPTGWQAPQEGNHQLPQYTVQSNQNQPIHHMQNLTAQQMPHPRSSETPQPQGQQFAYQQMQHMSYQRNMLMPGQHGSQQQNQPAMQGHQLLFNQHEYEAGLPQAMGRKVDPLQKSQSSFLTSQSSNVLVSQALPDGSKPVPNHPVFCSQAQNFGAFSAEQPASMVQFQQTGTGFAHHQLVPSFQSHTTSSISHNQQYDHPPAGLNMGYEDSPRCRAGDGYLSNAKVKGLNSSQPKLVSLPPTSNHQDLRNVGNAHNNFPAGFSSALNSSGHHGHPLHYNAAETPSFSKSNALDRAPFVPPFGSIGLSPEDLYRQEHEVSATGGNIPAPFISFEATGFPPEILRDIRSAGFLAPTPIQAQTWPIALENRDIVAIAKTGSGKTLGYLIPALILLRRYGNNPRNGPKVLVVAPTRELATQILEEIKKFGQSSRVSCTCLYGGAPKGPQLEQLDRGVDIVVATPGRLNDFLEMKKINLGQVSLLVLDEADRMLDMGFEPQIRKIVNEMPKQRQTLMYTATWPKEVKKIASDLLVNPIQVNIGRIDELAANKSITQYVEVMPQMAKERRLDQILRDQDRGSKVIVFCSTKRLCDQLARGIGRNFGAAAIHGDKSQGERDWVLNQFRCGISPVLVATDVAARGLDIKDIRVVINYDFPNGIEDYVHRIGRTGRAGATGVSYTFFSEQDWKHAADLVKLLEGANQHVPPEVRQIALSSGSGGKDRGGMGGRLDSGMLNDSERWNVGQRQGFGGRGRGGFNGQGVMRDGGFSIRGNSRDAPFAGRGGRYDSFSGRGNRGRGFGGPSHWGRNDRGPHDRSNYFDGRGRGRGRGRFDGRRELDTNRRRSYSPSPSPERVRRRRYNPSRSRSRSRSRSWSRSRSRSQSRSWSRSHSRSYSRSPRESSSSNRSRSRSRSRGLVGRRSESKFDQKEIVEQESKAADTGISHVSPAPNVDPLPESVCVPSATAVTQGAANQQFEKEINVNPLDIHDPTF